MNTHTHTPTPKYFYLAINLSIELQPELKKAREGPENSKPGIKFIKFCN